MKHTKGPWKVIGEYVYAGPFNADMDKFYDARPMLESVADIKKIKITGVNWRGDDKEQMNANANLIAAAPEMLEALELCANILMNAGQKPVKGNNLFIISELIKKAKGE